MSKLLILKGLPASGKSTFAKELVNKGWKRVNKDDLRLMVDGGKWSRANEKEILALERAIAFDFLSRGFNVVVDDTNFAHESYWTNMASSNNHESEIKFFDVPVMECVERDSKRGDKAVGAKVIFRMYDQYLRPKPVEWSEDKQNCYVFDVDGTLAKMNGRSPYDYSLVHTDTVNHNVAMIARLLAQSGLPIIILSGRTDDCKFETLKWLYENNIPHDAIYMRKTGDNRNDAIVKKELYEDNLKEKYNVLAIFDDRNRVVDMWRALGLTCLQVEYGNF